MNKCKQRIHTSPDFKKSRIIHWDFGLEPKCKEMEHILYVDDKDEFVKAVNRLKCADEFPPPHTLFKMFGLDAVNCTSAVHNGETSQIIDVNSTFYDDNKDSPLTKQLILCFLR